MRLSTSKSLPTATAARELSIELAKAILPLDKELESFALEDVNAVGIRFRQCDDATVTLLPQVARAPKLTLEISLSRPRTQAAETNQKRLLALVGKILTSEFPGLAVLQSLYTR